MSDYTCVFYKHKNTAARMICTMEIKEEIETAEIIIPSEIRKTPIDTIADNFFDDSTFPSAKNIHLVISEGIKNIGYRAFACCSKLTSITLPSTLEKIGDYAFSSTGIKEITIKGSVEIGECAFYECADLKKVDASSCYITNIKRLAFDKTNVTKSDVFLPYYMAGDEDFISKMLDSSTSKSPISPSVPSSAFNPKGKNIVITGKFSVTRATLERMISSAGGYVDTRVTSITDYLLVGDKPGSTKMKAARTRLIPNIPIKEVEAFIARS